MANTDLSKGSKAEIKEFQQAMNLLKHTGADGQPLTVDGVWGGNTRAAVKKFQAANNLTSDGVAGVNTVEALIASPELSNEKPNTVVPPKANSTGGLDQLPSVATPTTTQGASKAPTKPTTTPTTKTEPAKLDPAAQARLDAIKAIQTKRAAQQSAQNRVVKPDPHGEEQAGGVGPRNIKKKEKKSASQPQVSTNPAIIYNRPQNEQYQNKQQAMHVLKQIYAQYKAARQSGDKKTLNALLPRVVSMNTKAQNVYRLNPGIKNLSVKLKNLLDKALTESYNNKVNEGVWDTVSGWFGTDELVGGKKEAESEYNQFGFAATDTGIKMVTAPSIGAQVKITKSDYFGLFETLPWEFVEQWVKEAPAGNGYAKAFAKLLKKRPKKVPIEKKIENLPEELKQEALKIRDNFVASITSSIESLNYSANEAADEAYAALGQAVEFAQTLVNTYQQSAEHADLVAAVEGYDKLVDAVKEYSAQLT